MTSTDGPIPFVILQSELFFEARFAPPAFEVFRDPEGLHRALHEKLSPFGLRLADMKYERGTTLADVRLVCFLHNFSWTANVRAEQVDLQCFDLRDVQRQEVKDVAVSLVEAVTSQIRSTSVRTYTLALVFHVSLTGIDTRSFLLRFVQNAPDLGPLAGSGVAFYFGSLPEAGLVTSTITMDRSAVVADGLFVRLHSVWDAATVPAHGLPDAAEKHLSRALTSLGLLPPE